MAPPITSTTAQTIPNIVYGIVGTLLTVIVIWQARQWNRRHGQNDGIARQGIQSRDYPFQCCFEDSLLTSFRRCGDELTSSSFDGDIRAPCISYHHTGRLRAPTQSRPRAEPEPMTFDEIFWP